MFSIRTTAAGLVAAVLMAGTASAQQVISIGSTQTAIGTMASSVSSVVSTKTDLQMRPQAISSTDQYVPQVNANQIEFGIANAMQTRMSIDGTGVSEGRPNPNLRIVATLLPTQYAPMVAADSDITTTADLAGVRVPSGWASQSIGHYIVGAYLANGDVTWDDVQQVPVAGFDQQDQTFVEGGVDVMTALIGTGELAEIDIRKPVRFVSMDDSPEAVARMQEWVPGSYISVAEPAEGKVGVLEPINTMTQDFILFSNDQVSDDVVYEVVKAIYESETELKASNPLWTPFDPEGLAKDVGAEYHPGAIRFYQEVGLWPAE